MLLQFPRQQSVSDADALLQFTETLVRKHLKDGDRLLVCGGVCASIFVRTDMGFRHREGHRKIRTFIKIEDIFRTI